MLKTLHVVLAELESKRLDLAVVALDNDGPPTHTVDHEAAPERQETCRRCSLTVRVRTRPDGSRRTLAVAVAVPVPCIESWLVAVKDPTCVDPEGMERATLKYRVYGSKQARTGRVLKYGVPLAERLGREAETRGRVARTCPSFAAFLRSLEAALPGRLTLP